MSEGYKIRDQYAIHFITPSVVDWVDMFTRNSYRDVIIEGLSAVVGLIFLTNTLAQSR